MIIPVHIVVEDQLSEVVLRKIISICGKYCIGTCYNRGGYGYIKKNIGGFNNASKGTPFIVLCDLENACPPALIRKWLKRPKHHNLIFRIAVRETESWLLADSIGISSYLGVKGITIPPNIDRINDPKKFLIGLAKKSTKPKIRRAIVPSQNSTAQIGPDYNDQLSDYVNTVWDIDQASKNSDSLRRAIKAINTFKPEYS